LSGYNNPHWKDLKNNNNKKKNIIIPKQKQPSQKRDYDVTGLMLGGAVIPSGIRASELILADGAEQMSHGRKPRAGVKRGRAKHPLQEIRTACVQY